MYDPGRLILGCRSVLFVARQLRSAVFTGLAAAADDQAAAAKHAEPCPFAATPASQTAADAGPEVADLPHRQHRLALAAAGLNFGRTALFAGDALYAWGSLALQHLNNCRIR